MTRPRALTALAGGAAVLTLAAAAAPAAMASATAASWKTVYDRHYGAATAQNGFQVAVAPARDRAWVFGGTDNFSGTPIAARWTGGTWRNVSLPAGVTGNIDAASASSPGNIWAVTQLGQAVLHWNGHAWSVAKSWHKGGEFQLTGVTAISRTDVWVFGSGGFTGGLGTWHYNGHSWKHETAAAAGGITLASAVSGSDIWAIGSRSAPQDSIVRYFHGRWEFQTSPVLAGRQINSILAISAGNVWAVAAQQTNSTKSYLLHYNGSKWSSVSVPGGVAKNGQLVRLAADGHGGFWLQTAKRLLHRTDTGAWSSPLAQPQILALVAVPGTHLLLGAGAGPSATVNSSNAAVYEARLSG
jgi:hypothetical protein